MELRYNINKIHIDLSSRFATGEVKILEKSNLKFGKYFEISVIKESKEVRMIFTVNDLESFNEINWFYYENPLNESSDLVERRSNIDDLSSHVSDIFDKSRFSEDYLNKINN